MHKHLSSILATLLTVSSSALAYDLNFDPETLITHENRATSAITLSTSTLPDQTLPIDQPTSKKLYHNHASKAFVALVDQPIQASFAFSSDWMNSYIFIDLNNDNVFDPETELIAYSHLAGKNSAGEENNGNVLNPPAFKIPQNTNPGTYNARFKIDWDSNDPAGNNSQANNIVKNGGCIIDTKIIIAPTQPQATLSGNNCSVAIKGQTKTNIAFSIVPDEGYILEAAKLQSGYSAPGVQLINPELETTSSLHFPTPGKNTITIPLSLIKGDYQLSANALPAADYPLSDTPYPIASSTPLPQGAKPSVTVNGQTIAFDDDNAAGYYRASTPVNIPINSEINISCTAPENQKVSFMLDANQDGVFVLTPQALLNELAQTVSDANTHSATIPTPSSAGVYRIRVEIENGPVADLFANIHNPIVNISPMALNGLILKSDDSPLPETLEFGKGIRIKALPTLPGFETDKIIVRTGQNLNGPEFIMGNPQWTDSVISLSATGAANILKGLIAGDIQIFANFQEQPQSEWTKVWGDEFNSNAMDPDRWNFHPRYNATWNRLVAKTDAGRNEVNSFANGCYNSFAQATTLPDEDAEFITGAIYSHGKFAVKFGKIEARIKTTPHDGNFPAFWLMPAYSELTDLGLNGWPNDGEIDIWEQVNEDNRAHHTVHSGWTGWKDYNKWPKPAVESPSNTGSEWIDATTWHVYALEWTNDSLKYFVDGTLRFSYVNQHYVEPGSDKYIEKITWPFDKEFYIILNQSVGQQGGWAHNYDPEFVYHTHFDYVRVYQKKDSQAFTSTLQNNGDDPNFYVPAQGLSPLEKQTPEQSAIQSVNLEADVNAPIEIFNLRGQRINATTTPGIYIEKRGSKTRKIIVK